MYLAKNYTGIEYSISLIQVHLAGLVCYAHVNSLRMMYFLYPQRALVSFLSFSQKRSGYREQVPAAFCHGKWGQRLIQPLGSWFLPFLLLCVGGTVPFLLSTVLLLLFGMQAVCSMHLKGGEHCHALSYHSNFNSSCNYL